MCSLTLKESIITIIYFLLCLGLIFHGNNLLIDNSHDMSNHANCLFQNCEALFCFLMKQQQSIMLPTVSYRRLFQG